MADKKFEELSKKQNKGDHVPDSVIRLIVGLVEPYQGRAYNPHCNNENIFSQILSYATKYDGNIEFYGQINDDAIRKSIIDNLTEDDISCDLGEQAADVFYEDLHKDLEADYIVSIPPFNQKGWRAKHDFEDDYRWEGYVIPSKSNANYAWILHCISKLSENGVAGILLASGSLNSRGHEYFIRRLLIENDLVEAIINLPKKSVHPPNKSTSLWILNNNKSERTIKKGNVQLEYRNRKNEVLFLDLRQTVKPSKDYMEFDDAVIGMVVDTFTNWRSGKGYENIPEFSYSSTLNEIRMKDYSLVIGNYVEYLGEDKIRSSNAEMVKLKDELKELIIEEKESTRQILDILDAID